VHAVTEPEPPTSTDETHDTPPHGDPLLAATQGNPQGDGSRHGWDAHGDAPPPVDVAGDRESEADAAP
jgi:hypothetical protein